MQLLYIHDKGLGDHHPIFSRMNPSSKALFIWDDVFFKRRCYSLKRLVFIYETLCSMPVDIYYGDTKKIIKEISPEKILTPFTTDIPIISIINEISEQFDLEFVYPPSFAQIDENVDFIRFFKYWNKAKKTAFRKNTT